MKAKFAHVPYLNSSLFEITGMEDKTICIDRLQDSIPMALYSKSVLFTRRDKACLVSTMRPWNICCAFWTPTISAAKVRKIFRKKIQKFNDTKEWNCQTLNELYNKIENIAEPNEIFNSVRICDPSVGSGHFLVSALNEMIYLKSELGILIDKNGKKLKDYRVTVENDELIITDNEGNYFVYNPKKAESQRIQEVFFS